MAVPGSTAAQVDTAVDCMLARLQAIETEACAPVPDATFTIDEEVRCCTDDRHRLGVVTACNYNGKWLYDVLIGDRTVTVPEESLGRCCNSPTPGTYVPPKREAVSMPAPPHDDDAHFRAAS